MLPFFLFWEFSLGSEYDLIPVELIDESFGMSHIELSKKVIEQKHYGKIKLFFEKKHFYLLQSQKEHLILTAREIEAHII